MTNILFHQLLKFLHYDLIFQLNFKKKLSQKILHIEILIFDFIEKYHKFS